MRRALAVVLTAIPLLAPRAPGADEQGPEQALQGIRGTARLIAELAPSPPQVEALIPVVDEALAAAAQVEQRIRQSQQQAVRSYAALKEELAAQKVTQTTEQAAQRAHAQVKRLQEEDLVRALLACEPKIDTVLTADQVAFLIAYDENDKVETQRRRGCIREVRHLALTALERVRGMDEAELAKSGPAVYEGFVTTCTDDGLLVAERLDIEAGLAGAMDVFRRARAMSRADYLKARTELAAALCPRTGLPRPPIYSHKVYRGTPLRLLGRSSRQLFSEAAREILERMKERPWAWDRSRNAFRGDRQDDPLAR
ncbi:MAG: hypothetical protein JXR37_24075 [Kiritimatiellae bacterium]|nr:hypothetical protein [Kiritimatiellia bacterium]